MKSGAVRVTVGTVLLMLWIGCADAQEIWCSVEISVRDGRERTIGDVEVRASSDVLFESRSGMTADSGRYRFSGLPAGIYSVSAGKAGYQWVEIEEVACPPGDHVRLDIVVKAVDFEETVILGAGPSLDAGSSAVKSINSGAEMKMLPRAEPIESRTPVVIDGDLPGPTLTDVPFSWRAFSGRVVAGSLTEPEPRYAVTTPRLDGVFRGEGVVGVATGASAALLSTREPAIRLRRSSRVELSGGGSYAKDRFRCFGSFEERKGFSGDTDLLSRTLARRLGLLGRFGPEIVPTGNVQPGDGVVGGEPAFRRQSIVRHLLRSGRGRMPALSSLFYLCDRRALRERNVFLCSVFISNFKLHPSNFCASARDTAFCSLALESNARKTQLFPGLSRSTGAIFGVLRDLMLFNLEKPGIHWLPGRVSF